MDTRLIYEQMYKLTCFVKHLQPHFVKHLRKNPLVRHFGNTCGMETLIVQYVDLVI